MTQNSFPMDVPNEPLEEFQPESKEKESSQTCLPKQKKPRKPRTAGGFKVLDVPKEKTEEPTSQEGAVFSLEDETEVPKDQAEPLFEVTQEVNQALIRSTCLVVSKLLVHFTHVEAMAFDEDETNHLVALWSSLIPAFSPLATALLGTSVIVVGKVGIYVSAKRGGTLDGIVEENP